MKYGYARVSTREQNLEMQIDALEKYDCDIILKEKKSSRAVRPELDRIFSKLKKDDVLIIYKLDRIGRTLRDLINKVAVLRDMDCHLISIKDGINTTTPVGRLMFHVMAALAEFELDATREKTNDGLEAARARGRKGGRPSGLSPANLKIAQSIKILYDSNQKTMEEIATSFNKSRATCYRYLHHINSLESN